MGLVDTFKSLTQPINEYFGWAYSEEPVQGNMPIFPEWYFSAKIGQPRAINIQEVRAFAKSPWVQMVLNTMKREVSTIDWEIIPKDPDSLPANFEEKIKIATDFFNNINSDKETINDLHSMMLTDVGEIDSGVLVKIYSNDSYEETVVPLYDEFGNEINTQTDIRLKPFGERTLLEVRPADGSTFLKQIDIYRRLLAYYQYSFRNPRTNPKRFEPDEVLYYYMNKKSSSLYGFSPVQAVMQVIETLMQATRWNKDFFKNNAMPSGIVSIPGIDKEQLKLAKESWLNSTKGKPHKMMFQNKEANFTSFATNARDMEWLEGQKWYFHLVFGVFGVSPVEAGFHENTNQGNQAGQERITVKNGIKPQLRLFENQATNNIIPELFQEKDPGIKFVYKPKEHVEEQIEFEQDTKLIELGIMTVNEFRKSRNLDPVEWGDEPINSGSGMKDNEAQTTPQQDPSQSDLDQEKKQFQKRFEDLLQ